jgi:hypothetical protein
MKMSYRSSSSSSSGAREMAPYMVNAQTTYATSWNNSQATRMDLHGTFASGGAAPCRREAAGFHSGK